MDQVDFCNDDKRTALADFLGIKVDQVRSWSDGSFTTGDNDSNDYKLTLSPSSYGIFQGRAGKYYVNKN
ncbi:hypothetical protein [Paenibacillus odorifer]|uniref:hypothetical protein n=1 Tax=Paenibacillus odorifer TaxID=189426 RepID=UPI00096DAB78|nr:hypothetical protein [Paenibacillus odorifer]OMD10614.1 hypothetical protein BJP50_28275 [Paenibacillus odorifer]